MKQKINFRLALIALIAIFTTTIGIILIFYNLFQSQVREDLRTSAQLLEDTGLFQEVSLSADTKIETENSFLNHFDDDDLRITWIDESGTVLYDNETDASSMPNHLDRPEIQQALENGTGECVRRSDTMKKNTYYYAILLDNQTILRVSMEAPSIASVYFSAVPFILIVCVIILSICILIGHLLTRKLLKPIAEMAENLDDCTEPSAYRELEPFAEKIRAQHEKILESATSRQDFTANVSHELKTPLTAISGYAELMETGMIQGDQSVQIAAKIHQNASRLLSLINDIIRLSELDHTEMPRNFEPVNLKNLAEDCCQNMQMTADQHKIELSCRGENAEVSGDRELLKELLENLIHNSIRYNHENGWVSIRTYTEKGHPVLSVKDNGIGIPKDKQERVFERFYRVDKSRSRETGGTGLGLAIVKHIAEIHHARIELESELNQGTEIRILF